MDHVIIKSSLMFQRQKRFLTNIRVWIMGIIMLGNVASGDEMGVPDTGVLCISDCATCPVICSPPPPKQSYTPPITHHSPPQSYYHSPTTPPPPAPSPPSPSPEKSEPPPSYTYWDTPPPPPFKYNNYMPPAAIQGPATPGGQHKYPYPYYYFYASEASFLSGHGSIFFEILFYWVVLFFC